MQPIYGRCDEEMTITRDEGVRAIEISCGCGSFRWAPSESGDVGDRPLDALEAEAISLWNFQYGDHARISGMRPR
jgi:hypothetical protein